MNTDPLGGGSIHATLGLGNGATTGSGLGGSGAGKGKGISLVSFPLTGHTGGSSMSSMGEGLISSGSVTPSGLVIQAGSSFSLPLGLISGVAVAIILEP